MLETGRRKRFSHRSLVSTSIDARRIRFLTLLITKYR